MTLHQPLIDHIEKRISLTQEEMEQFVSCFKTTKVKKRQLIIQPGFVSQFRNFVLEGALRAYVVGEEGTDHTIAFAIEDWWITDYNSYVLQQPGTMFVIALEDSTILQLYHEDEKKLKSTNPKFETFFRIMAERTAASMQRRIITNLTLTAEARYDLFMEKYPTIAQRVPQYALASFLGMTTEFLSKIRNNKVKKKS